MLGGAESAPQGRGAGEPVHEHPRSWGRIRRKPGGGPSTSSPSANLAGAIGGVHALVQRGPAAAFTRGDPRLAAPSSHAEAPHGSGLAVLTRRRARRRLRRHRDEPAVRAAGVLPRRPRHRADPRERARRAVADFLVADADHLDQVPRVRHARRQQRGGRHSRAAGARRAVPRCPAAQPRDARGARAVRGGAALRRRDDYAGHFGARRGRRPAGRDARLRALHRPADGRHPLRTLPHSVARHRARRLAVRAGDDRLVRHDRRARRAVDRPGPGRSDVVQSAARRHLFPRQRVARLHRARLGVPRRHRRRGAVRRHGPLRQEAHPAGVVRSRPAGAPAELSGAGRDAADRPLDCRAARST